MSVQSSLVMFPIYAYGTTEQKEKYLPKLGNLVQFLIERISPCLKVLGREQFVKLHKIRS